MSTYDEIMLTISRAKKMESDINQLKQSMDTLDEEIVNELRKIPFAKIFDFVVSSIDSRIVKELKKKWNISMDINNSKLWKQKIENRGFDIAIGTLRINNYFKNVITSIPLLKIQYNFDGISAEVVSKAYVAIHNAMKGPDIGYTAIELDQDKYKDILKRAIKKLSKSEASVMKITTQPDCDEEMQNLGQ